MRPNELTGNRYGRLVATSRYTNDTHGKARWLCKCDCGKEAVVAGAKLKNGHTKSCGCMKIEMFTAMARNKKPANTICMVDGCNRKASGKYCGMHRARLQRGGSLEIKRRHNGTGSIGKNGYVDIRIDGRRVYEHVLVAERALGKPLPKGAIVHHMNCDRKDNRPENLVICPNEAYHRLIHKRMRKMGGGHV